MRHTGVALSLPTKMYFNLYRWLSERLKTINNVVLALGFTHRSNWLTLVSPVIQITSFKRKPAGSTHLKLSRKMPQVVVFNIKLTQTNGPKAPIIPHSGSNQWRGLVDGQLQ